MNAGYFDDCVLPPLALTQRAWEPKRNRDDMTLASQSRRLVRFKFARSDKDLIHVMHHPTVSTKPILVTCGIVVFAFH